MRLSRLVPSILLIGSGVAAATVLSRAPATEPVVSELSGTIASIGTASLSVRPDAEGSVVTFVVDDLSSLPAGLIAGTRVNVSYETRDGGGRRPLSVGLADGVAPLQDPSTLQEPATMASAPLTAAARQGQLRLAALVLLLATGAYLVISSWR